MLHFLSVQIMLSQECELTFCRSGKEYTRVLQTNVVGPFLVTQHFLPLLKKKNTKVVVNTSSICGSISANAAGTFKGLLLPYNSSKAAINMRKFHSMRLIPKTDASYVCFQMSEDMGTCCSMQSRVSSQCFLAQLPLTSSLLHSVGSSHYVAFVI